MVTQPNRWSCLPTAFAVVMGVDVHELIKRVGHDGSEVIWPKMPEPKNRRAFHIQEMIRVAHFFGFATVPFETVYESAPNLYAEPYVVKDYGTVKEFMSVKDGVITIPGHAFAWVNGKAINPDPLGKIEMNLERITCFYNLIRI